MRQHSLTFRDPNYIRQVAADSGDIETLVRIPKGRLADADGNQYVLGKSHDSTMPKEDKSLLMVSDCANPQMMNPFGVSDMSLLDDPGSV